MIVFMQQEYGLSLEQMMDVPMAFMLNRMIDRGRAQQRAEQIKNQLAMAEMRSMGTAWRKSSAKPM